MGLDHRPAHARGLGIGMGGARGIKMPVKRIKEGTYKAVRIGNGGDFPDFPGGYNTCFKSHKPVFGPFRQQHVEPVAVVGQGDAAHMMQPAGHAGDRFQLLVKADGIALERGHVGVAVQRMKPARRVPGGAAGQIRSLNQHHI